jgi:hypothetical protein
MNKQKSKTRICERKCLGAEENSYLNIFADFSVYALIKTIVKINK